MNKESAVSDVARVLSKLRKRMDDDLSVEEEDALFEAERLVALPPQQPGECCRRALVGAARVAESHADQCDDTVMGRRINGTATDIADAIRALTPPAQAASPADAPALGLRKPIGASYHRDTDAWIIYHGEPGEPGQGYQRIGQFDGWEAEPIVNAVLAALRASLADPSGDEALVEAVAKLKLWFFRECNEGTRRHLFALFGLPVEEIRNHGTETMAFKHIVGLLTGKAALAAKEMRRG